MAAVTARFVADFSSFQDAVKKADISLKNVEADANKVGASLNRMVDNFSGRKLINDANLMTQAVKDVGGATALTEKEMARVNSTVTEAIAKYTALGKTAPKSMTDLAAATTTLGTATEKTTKPVSALSGWFTNLGTQLVSTAAGFVSAQAVIGLANKAFDLFSSTIRGSITAFAEAESAQTKLVAALRSQHQATPDVISQYNKLASQFQDTTVFSDDLINSMQGLLVQVGGVMPRQMEAALKASTDLAAGLGIDLETATTLVAKAAAGHTETLGKYGIQVSEAEVKTKGLTAVLDAINKQFGGQAAAQLDTYAGRVQQVANAWNNLQEVIGKSIVQNPLVVAGIRLLQEQLGQTDKKTQEWKVSLGDLFDLMDRSGASGALVKRLEAYVDNLNEIATAWERLNKIPSPFKQVAEDMQQFQDPGGLAFFDATVKAEKAIEEQAKKTAESQKKFREELARTKGEMIRLESSPSLDDFSSSLQKLGTAVPQRFFDDISKGISGVMTLNSQGGEALTEFTEKLTHIGEAIPQKFFDDLAKTSDLAIRLNGFIGPTEKITSKFETLHAVLGGIENILGGIQTKFAQLAVVAARTIDGIVKSLEKGDWLGALVAGITGATDAFLTLFTNAEKAINPVRQAYVDAAGGLDKLRDKATAAGTSINNLLNAKNAKDYKHAIDELNQAFSDMEKELSEIDKLKGTFDKIGGALSESMRDALRQLASIPGLSKDAAAALMGLANDTQPNFKELEKTAEEYGITLAQLGSKFQQAHVSDEAAKIISDFENLKNAGADVGSVINGMADEVQHVVDESAKFGVDVPENMRPMIEAMINAGLLTDAAGKKITDISKIKFGAPVETEADKIAKAIKDLGELFEKLPTIMADAVKGINNSLAGINTRHDIDIYTHHHDVYDNPVAGAATGGYVTATGIQNFAGGGRVLPFRARGTDTVPAMLTPGEGILSRADMLALGGIAGFKSLRDVLRTGGSGGDSSTIEKTLADIRSELRRSRLTGPATIARAVRDEVQKAGGRR